MAKRSAFRDFIKELKKDWRTTFPSIRPIEESFGPAMPKASTFYAGFMPATGMHVFLNFQHSSKSWQVGQFTVNVVLSQQMGPPLTDRGPVIPDDIPLPEGTYRVGPLLGRKDKWWHLKNDETPILFETWRPASYDDDDAVLREAVADVSRDIESVRRKLGMTEAEGQADV